MKPILNTEYRHFLENIRDTDDKLGTFTHFVEEPDKDHLSAEWFDGDVAEVEVYKQGHCNMYQYSVMIAAAGKCCVSGVVGGNPFVGEYASGKEMRKEIGVKLSDTNLWYSSTQVEKVRHTSMDWLRVEEDKYFSFYVLLPTGEKLYPKDFGYSDELGGTLIECFEEFEDMLGICKKVVSAYTDDAKQGLTCTVCCCDYNVDELLEQPENFVDDGEELLLFDIYPEKFVSIGKNAETKKFYFSVCPRVGGVENVYPMDGQTLSDAMNAIFRKETTNVSA